MFVAVELFLTHCSSLTAVQLGSTMGMLESLLFTVYHLMLFVALGPSRLLLSCVAASGSSPVEALLGFLALVGANLGHALAFFRLLGRLGAVGMTVLKALQSAAVLLLSSLIFCGQESSQCLSLAKGLSGLIVVTSGLFYGLHSSKGKGLASSPQRGSSA